MKRTSMVYAIVLSFSLIVVGEALGSFMVDPERFYSLPGGQDYPVISAGTNGFFAVWQDERTGTKHIYGKRISKAGVVLDTCGILISSESSPQYNPTIAFGYYGGGLKDNYLAAWWDGRTTPVRMYGTRISGTEVVDTAGILIETFEYGDRPPSIAYGSSNKYLVVWDTWDGDIFGRMVDVNGNIGVRFDICTEAHTQYSPKVSFNGTNFFVVWQDNRDGYWEIYGARVTPAGSVLDPSGIKLVNASGARGRPDVAFCDSLWLCVWVDSRSGSDEIYATRITGNGTVLDPTSIYISDNFYSNASYPAISSNSTNFMVVWIENKTVYDAVVDTSGSVLSIASMTVIPLVTYRQNTDVAFCDTAFFSVWNYAQPGLSGIVGNGIRRNGYFFNLTWWKEVGITTTIQTKPDCAFGGDSALVFWEDNAWGDQIGMINSSGNLVKDFFVDIGLDKPSVAFTDPYYLCAWHQEADSTIRAKRITRNGAEMSSIGIEGTISYTPCLDVDGGEGTFCVGWIDLQYPKNVYFSILDTGGVIVWPTTNISNTPASVTFLPFLSVCFNDNNHNYLIAWQEEELMEMYDSIFCTMVSKTGGILYQRVCIAGGIGEGEHPSLTFDGTNYFCVWKKPGGVKGRWISTAVVPGDTCFIPFNINNPEVNFYGTGYFLTGEREGKIWGARLTMSGAIVDTFEIGEGKEHSADTREGKYLVTWSSFTPCPYSSYRVYGQFSSLTGIEDEEENAITPKDFELYQSYPNPFNNQTIIKYDLLKSSQVILTIYNILGQKVKTLVKERQAAGSKTVGWDGKDEKNKDLASGIYFYQFKAGEVTQTKRMILLK